MTHFSIRSLIVITALSAIAETAYGQICVTSDPTIYNTACGTGALNLNEGYNNSAFGYQALYHNSTDGFSNSAFGYDALIGNSDGSYNTATGYEALKNNVGGSNNTAIGYQALLSNTSNENTASGSQALIHNVSGSDNTATGYAALVTNVSGSNNTASGYQALLSNATGSDNTAMGHDALEKMTVGDTTAIGAFALAANTTGAYNTALGNNTLQTNSSGASNTAVGYWALQANTGNNNTANGYQALLVNSTGSNNIAIGYHAGSELTTGSNNVDIGSEGTAADNKVIRIGTKGTQTKTFIAGIYGNTAVSGLAVVIGSNGELGVVSSSERFKTDITAMGSTTEKLQQLRPVMFHYKADAQDTLRYGLIAEEVAKVYPELVVRDQNGGIDGVRYDELAPMLLNEVQKQQRVNATQAARIASLEQQLAGIQAALVKLQPKDALVAQR